MEFKFNVNKLLPREINRITHSLIPEDFKGDRRELNECQRQLTRILDEMGEASARAQGLSKPITSAQKLRDTDHIVYLMVDAEGNGGLGSVIGLLKTGSKNLFMFDENGAHYRLQPRCVLDFYIHESRQRMGLGNILYEYMLAKENVTPMKLAIDRPSDKFLAFLRKYYGLSEMIPQNNKFVVFRGFFDDERQQDASDGRYNASRSSYDDIVGGGSKPATGNRYGDNNKNLSGASMNGIAHEANVSRGSYGRYAAARPPCSMANIIHNTPVLGPSVEHSGDGPTPPTPNFQEETPAAAPKVERPRSLSLYSEEEQKQRANEDPTSAIKVPPTPIVPVRHHEPESILPSTSGDVEKVEAIEKIDKEKTLKPSPSCAQEVTGSHHHGHLDLKFYHSPLW